MKKSLLNVVITEDDRVRFKRAAYLRGFRQKHRDGPDVSAWLRTLLLEDAAKVERLIKRGKLPNYLPPPRDDEVSVESASGVRHIAPPCNHVRRNAWCDRCGAVRRK